MPKRYGYSFTLAALMTLMVGFAFQADAGFLIFSDRAAWQAALGSGAGLAYNFNGLTHDVSFATSAFNFGPFSLSARGALPPDGTDKVFADSPSNQTVNGSPFASMFLDSTRSVDLDFTNPALAFGADFLGNAMNFGVFLHGSSSPIIVQGPTSDRGYFGLISTDPIDRIEFLYSGPEGSSTTVNFDDVGLASATPAPSTLMMLATGAIMFAAYSCWRLRRGKIEVGPDQA
jgi:hypothetical protein